MDIKQDKYKLSILIKLFAGLVLVIVPLYLLGLYINLSGARDIRKGISKSISEQVNYYLSTLESEIERIIKVQREYMNDPYILKLSVRAETISDYERIGAILNVMSNIQTLKTVSPYVKNVSIHIPLINRTISTDYSINELNLDELNILKPFTSLYGSPVIRWGNRLFLNVPFIDPKLSYSKKPVFDISVELSQTELVNNLNKLISHEGSAAFIIDRMSEWSAGGNQRLISFARSFIGQAAEEDLSEGQETVRVDGRTYLMVYKASKLLDFVLFVLIPQRAVMVPLDSYSRLSWILSGLSGFIIIIFTIWIYKLVMQPLDKLISAFGQVEEGNLDVAVYRKSRDEFGYLYHQFNAMVKNLKSLFQQTYEQKARLKNAELKQLQYQINPHFLYNSIFLIYRMAKVEDYNNIIRLSQHLGNYYQFITRNAKDEIPFRDEINHAKDYTEIQNIRFGDRIHVIWEQDEGDYDNILVPRLILQPLIENAYYHGLRNKASGGMILIRLSANPYQVNISIQDNGSELEDGEIAALQQSLMDVSGEMEVTAILNIHRRLQIRYGNDSGITVCKGELGGLKVNLNICLKGNQNV